MTDEPGGSLSSADPPGIVLDEEARRQMREHFQRVPLHALLRLEVVELGESHAVVRMPVDHGAMNSTGNLHGGSLATLIDVAAGTAAALGSRFEPGRQSLVTADLHVRYLGRPHGDWVHATARVMKAGRQLVVVECRVTDDEQRIVAAADFSSMLVPLRQPLRPLPDAQHTHPDI